MWGRLSLPAGEICCITRNDDLATLSAVSVTFWFLYGILRIIKLDSADSNTREYKLWVCVEDAEIRVPKTHQRPVAVKL